MSSTIYKKRSHRTREIESGITHLARGGWGAHRINYSRREKGKARFLTICKGSTRTRIASTNVGRLRPGGFTRKITTFLQEKRIDVASIQESHNGRMGTREEKDYVITLVGDAIRYNIDATDNNDANKMKESPLQ